MIEWIKSWFRRTPEQEYKKLFDDFVASRQDSTTTEILDELTVRRSYQKVRRIVSEKTIKNPNRYREHLQAATKAEGYVLQAVDKRLGFAFLRVIKASGPHEILTSEAFARYVAANRMEPFAPDQDAFAALRL